MARGCLYFCVVSLFLFAMGTVPLAAERDLDLTAADGTRLKATYFPAAQPGPGVLLIHQCNRQSPRTCFEYTIAIRSVLPESRGGARREIWPKL